MKKKNLAALLMAAATCFGLLAGCSGSGNTGAFKLGGIGPLTTDTAIYGKAAMNGAQIAVDLSLIHI